MWELSRPLIEAWMIKSRSPEARLGRAGKELAGALERLPGLLHALEETLGQMAGGGLKLHPDTLRALRGERDGQKGFLSANRLFWLTGLALLLAIFLLK